MTKFPENNDKPLVDFLRQHAGTPPPPAPNLETQIMQAVTSSTTRQQTPSRRYLWVVPPAIAASLLIAGAVHQILHPPSPEPTLEAFMKDNWDSVLVGEGTDTDWLSVQ